MKRVGEIGGKIMDTHTTMEIDANLCPEFIRYSLKGLSKSQSIHRVHDVLNQFQNRRNVTRTLEFSLECNLLKKRSEFQSVKFIVDANEREIHDERDILLALDRKNHCDSSEMAEAYERKKFLQILLDQKKMIDVNDTLGRTRRYNEEELNSAMDEFKRLIAIKHHDISFEAEVLLLERERMIENSSEDMHKEFDHFRMCCENIKRDQSVEIKLLEEEIKRIKEKPGCERSIFE